MATPVSGSGVEDAAESGAGTAWGLEGVVAAPEGLRFLGMTTTAADEGDAVVGDAVAAVAAEG